MSKNRLASAETGMAVRLEEPYGIDPLRVDSSISLEHSADYWRERAECLEELVCELLRKNQVLRMDLQNVLAHGSGSKVPRRWRVY